MIRHRRAAVCWVAVAVSPLALGCSEQGSREAFCETAPEVPVVRDPTALDSPEGEELLGELLGALERLRDASPGEVRNDVNILVSVTRKLRQALADAADGEGDDAVGALQQDLDDYAAASARVVDYAERSCGLELDR